MNDGLLEDEAQVLDAIGATLGATGGSDPLDDAAGFLRERIRALRATAEPEGFEPSTWMSDDQLRALLRAAEETIGENGSIEDYGGPHLRGALRIGRAILNARASEKNDGQGARLDVLRPGDALAAAVKGAGCSAPEDRRNRASGGAGSTPALSTSSSDPFALLPSWFRRRLFDAANDLSRSDDLDDDERNNPAIRALVDALREPLRNDPRPIDLDLFRLDGPRFVLAEAPPGSVGDLLLPPLDEPGPREVVREGDAPRTSRVVPSRLAMEVPSRLAMEAMGTISGEYHFLVVMAVDGVLSVTGFEEGEEQEAIAYYLRAKVNWSDVYLCSVIAPQRCAG